MTPAPVLHFSVLAPIGFVASGAMLVLLGEVLLSRRQTLLGRRATASWIGSLLALVSIVSLLLAFYVAWAAFLAGRSEVFDPANPIFQLDRFSALITAVIALAALLSCALAIAYLAELRINHGEYYALLLLATSGMMLMVSAIDLLTVFLGLELMSIPIYVLAGFDRRRLRSNESALKYFLIGSFASAILLYGMALLYGTTGSTAFAAIRQGFDPANPIALVGLGLVIVGFSFKISAAPFHQWTPDVYEGAPAAVTAFMSVTVKIAAVATLLRLVALAFGPLDQTLTQVLWGLAALTIVVGNVMAVIQDNVKRLLAYSSIAHAGYLLVGFVTGTAEGYSAVVFYLLAYIFMNLGAFAVVVALAQRGQDCERIESFAGLAQAAPRPRRADDPLHALARRHPGHRRLHREVHHLRRRRERRRHLAHHPGPARERGLRLLLPAPARPDVHARALRRRSPAASSRAAKPWCSASALSRWSSWGSSRTGAAS